MFLSNDMNKTQIFIGTVTLILGSLVYLVDRPPEQTYFLYFSNVEISLHSTLPNLFGFLGNLLPAFAHAFSFILITAGIIGCGKRGYLTVCLSWLIVDWTFELGQKYSDLAVELIPGWFAGIPILEATSGYFRVGTFDVLDMAAVLLGAGAAYFVLMKTNSGFPRKIGLVHGN